MLSGATGAGGSKVGGGATSPGGGGRTDVILHLDKGQTVYIGVGEGGYTGGYNYRWNGGGAASGYEGYYTGNGGGAAHLATTNRGELRNYASVYATELIAVAGGGGGGSNRSNGGNGNAAGSGDNGVFGCGSSGGAGGGGGFYGGHSGANSAGGSGYVNTAFTSQYSIASTGDPFGGNGGAIITFISKN